jgi:ribonuclease J
MAGFFTGDWKLDDEPQIGVLTTAEELTVIGDDPVGAGLRLTNVFNPEASGLKAFIVAVGGSC